MTSEEGKSRTRFLPSSIGWGFWTKLAVVALFDALIVLALPILFTNRSWFLLTALISSGLLVNYAYLSPRATAARWLTPGLIFMAVFVVWPVIYTSYVSLTNWATGNVLSKEQAVSQLERQVILTEGEGVSLEMHVYRDPGGELAFLLRKPDGTAYFGYPRAITGEPAVDPLIDLAILGVDVSAEAPAQIGDFSKLTLRDLFGIANELETLVLDIPGEGIAQVQTTSSARLIKAGQRYRYDPVADTLYDSQADITCVAEQGNFVCPDGKKIDPGWVALVGLENYTKVLTNERVRAPFLRVFSWNLLFAAGSVFLTFALGLTLANALSESRLRGRAIYRSIFIIPYAIPAFLSVLVWRGLLNDRFGQVNRVIEGLGLDGVPWLLSPFWAKIAILLVNTWLGFPYMYLITAGALTSIPDELKEAARVDGASAWRVFRTITLPLLLVSTAPLLIGSFAFNFNNFVLIYMLTNGGPPVTGAEVPVGETDILISFAFDIAIRSGRGQNFALASAFVVVIFIVVAAISAISFRFTKRLEEIYGST